MRAIDADHLKRWILSRAFKTQLSVTDVIDQIDRENTIEPEHTCVGCKHRGKWENEVEYGCNSPCTNCRRRINDNYEQ